MKELTGGFGYQYRWWRNDGKGIANKDVEELEDHAFEQIEEWLKDGYTSGQLLAEIGDRNYVGYWEKS